MKLKDVGYWALLISAVGLVSCQTYDPNAAQLRYAGPGETIGRGIDTAIQSVGSAAKTGTVTAAQSLSTATRNVGWFARNSATNAGYGLTTAATGVGDATQSLGHHLFRPARLYPSEYDNPRQAPANPAPRLSRYDASVKGYRIGYQDAQNNLPADPAAATQTATSINQRAYYRAYVRGWNAGHRAM